MSPAYSCLGCHNDDPDDLIPEKTLAQAVAGAKFMHSPAFISQHELDIALGVYPNPSRGLTNVNFTLTNSEIISLEIFNTSGQLVYSLKNEYYSTGTQVIRWDGASNTGANIKSGYYFIQLTAGNSVSVQKLVMMK